MLRGFWVAAALMTMACGGAEGGGDGSAKSAAAGDPVCEAGRVAECPCVDSAEGGVQACDDDGGGWGMCECPAKPPEPVTAPAKPRAYKPEEVCVLIDENFDTANGCRVSGLRIFEKCVVPDDGLLVGCVPGTGGLALGFCCL